MDGPLDRLPYGVDTIVLRMTWENPARRPLARGRWDIARGARPGHVGVGEWPAAGFDTGVVPIADKGDPAGRPPALPLPLASRPSLLSPDSRPPTLFPLAPNGINENPPFTAGGGSRGGSGPGGRALPPRSVAPPPMLEILNPASPEQQLRLRRALEQTGQIRPNDGNAAHHNVPQGGPGMTGQRDPTPSQNVLRQFSIDLNSAENGVALSQGFHRRIHTNAYYAYVERNITSLATREDVVDWLSSFRQQLLEADREFQQSGQLPNWITGAVP